MMIDIEASDNIKFSDEFSAQKGSSTWIYRTVPAYPLPLPGEEDPAPESPEKENTADKDISVQKQRTRPYFPQEHITCKRDILFKSPYFLVLELQASAPTTATTSSTSTSTVSRGYFRVVSLYGTAPSIRALTCKREYRMARSYSDAEAVYCSIYRDYTSPTKKFRALSMQSPLGRAGAYADWAPSASTLPSLLPAKVARLVQVLLAEAARSLAARGLMLDAAAPVRVDRAVLVLMRMRDLLDSEDGTGVDKLAGGDGAALERDFFKELPSDVEAQACSDKSHGKRRLIATPEALDEWFETCSQLKDVLSIGECAAPAAADMFAPNASGSVDLVYQAMGCSIEYLPPGTTEHAMVCTAFLGSANTNANFNSNSSRLTVRNVFRVGRPADYGRFAEGCGGRRLLFHGTRPANAFGILARGMLLPQMSIARYCLPQVAPVNGSNLGCALYFSDCGDASLRYTSPAQNPGASRFMFACDVALGREYTTCVPCPTLVAPPPGYDSVHALPGDPAFPNDEYAVYTTAQQRLRYLVEFTTEDLISHTTSNNNGSSNSNNDDNDYDSVALKAYMDKNYRITQRLGLAALANGTTGGDGSKSSDNESSRNNRNNSGGGSLYGGRVSKPAVNCGLRTASGKGVPLEAVSVYAKVMDFVGEVTILQQYFNEGSEDIEGKFLFPLDEGAAITGFEAFVNDKHVVATAKEKEAARKEYKEAVARGDGAYLLDEAKEANVFTIAIGNIPARTRVVIKITYILEIETEASTGRRRFVWSSALTSGQTLAGTFLSQNTTSSVSADTSAAAFRLELGASMSSHIRSVTSPTHAIRVKKTSTKAVALYTQPNGFPYADLVILIETSEPRIPSIWVEEPKDSSGSSENAVMLSLYPEMHGLGGSDGSDATYYILLDLSNSMAPHVETAKEAAAELVSALPEFCRFNVVLFGTSFDTVFLLPTYKTQRTAATAIGKIHSAQATWGTSNLWQVFMALFTKFECCSADPNTTSANDDEYERGFESKVLFIVSDGDFSNDANAIKLARLHCAATATAKTRIFPVGVGPTPHRHNMKTLARIGAGSAEFVGLRTDVNGTMARLVQRTVQPSYGSVSVQWGDFAPWQVMQAPSKVRSIFSGERAIVYGFLPPGCTHVTLTATDSTSGAVFHQIIPVNIATSVKGRTIHCLTARTFVKEWADESIGDDFLESEVTKKMYRRTVIDLGVKYSIATPLTSFIAVEDRSSNMDKHPDGKLPETPPITEIAKDCDVDEIPHCSSWAKYDPFQYPGPDNGRNAIPIGLGIAWDHKTVYDYWEPYNPCEVDASIQEWGKEKRTPCNSIENRLVPVPGYCTSCSMRNMSRGVVPPNALKLNFSTDLLEANLGDNYSIFLDVCLKRSKVVITACSFMDLESWNAIGKTLDLGERTKDGMFPLIVIGTKGDLMGKAVQPEEAQAYCAKLGLPFVETSSLTGKGVKKAIKEAILEYIALDVMGRSPPTRPRIKRKFLAWDIGQEAQITTNTVSKEKPLDTNLNILLVGDPGVGKSAFISRYTSGLFITDYMPTIEDSIRANCTLGDDDDDDDDDYNNNNNGDGDVRMYTTRACNYMALAAAPMCCSTITAAAADVAAASFCSVESMKFENAGFGAAAPPPPPPPPMAGAAPPPPPMTAAAAQPGMLFGAAAAAPPPPPPPMAGAAAAAPPPPPPPMARAAAAAPPPPPVTMKKMKKMEAPHKNMCDEEVDEDEENDDSEYSDYYYDDDDDEDDDEAGYDYMSYGCLADECNYTKSFPKAKKSSKFCFIATAAYGTPLDPRLDSLRWFRDTWLPCWFVDAYYAVSPPIAHWIEDHEWARFVVRCLIWPIVQAIDHPLEAFLLVLSLLTVIASYLIYAIIFSNH